MVQYAWNAVALVWLADVELRLRQRNHMLHTQARGNEAFSAHEFEEALKFYTKGVFAG